MSELKEGDDTYMIDVRFMRCKVIHNIVTDNLDLQPYYEESEYLMIIDQDFCNATKKVIEHLHNLKDK